VQQRPATSPPPPAAAAKGGPSLAVSKQVKAAYEAKLTELEYKERSGEMGNLQDVRKEAARLARQVRDLLLIVPSRNAAKVAAMSDPEDIRALLQEEIELALKGMANG
jgi:phage terminase Nu1 subunit (DNA packaging protein)